MLSTLDGLHSRGRRLRSASSRPARPGSARSTRNGSSRFHCVSPASPSARSRRRLSGHEPAHERLEAVTLFAAHRCPDRRRRRPAPRAAGRGHRPVDRVAQLAGVRGALPGRAPALVPGRAADGDHHLRLRRPEDDERRPWPRAGRRASSPSRAAPHAQASSDVAVRLGGDEFALLLPDADLETALAVAERARAISSETISGFRPSGSFGVASFPSHGRTMAELLRPPTTRCTRRRSGRRRRRLRRCSTAPAPLTAPGPDGQPLR